MKKPGRDIERLQRRPDVTETETGSERTDWDVDVEGKDRSKRDDEGMERERKAISSIKDEEAQQSEKLKLNKSFSCFGCAMTDLRALK